MELSQYTSLVEVDDNTWLAFNHTRGELIRATKPVWKFLNGDQRAALDEETLAKLRERGFVVESRSGELDYVSHNLNNFRFGRPVVNVSIVLTYACNMRCEYCYETARHPAATTMTSEMAAKLVNEIKQQADKINARGVALTLYGGEPILNRRVARQIIDALRSYCTRRKLHFETILITNGTLITPEVVEDLKYGMKFAQLTLEGSPAYHDSVRIGPNKKGTFHRILESGRMFLDAGVGVQWRIQVSPQDWEGIDDCLQELTNAGLLQHPNVNIYFFPILDIQDVCSAKSFACYEEYFSPFMLEHFWRISLKYKANLFRLPAPIWHTPYCSFVNKNTWIVDPSGRQFKCVAEIGHDDAVCGSVAAPLSGVERTRARSRMLRVVNRTGMDFDECPTCEYLPSCDSGCGYRASARTGTWASNSCEMHKGVVPHQIAYYYKFLREQGQDARVETI